MVINCIVCLKIFTRVVLLQSDGCIEENSDPESQAAMTGSLQ